MDDTELALAALTEQFFRAVSFKPGHRPTYPRLRALFMDDGS